MPLQFNTKSLLLFPVMILLFVGASHAIYLWGLTLAETVVNVRDLPSWSILGWGVADDIPGWLLLMVVTFTLGLRRSKATGMAAWLLSLSFPLAEAILHRRLPILLVLEAGGVQLMGSLLGCVAWAAGWWISGQTKIATRANRANSCWSITKVALAILLLLSFPAYGWWGLSVNTFQVARPARPSAFHAIGDILIVPKAATNVSHTVAPDNSLHVAFRLVEEYPASKVIEQISNQLERLGWKPLMNDWLSPELPSSHVAGWDESIDATRTPPYRTLQWKGQWMDSEGNVIGYTFTYSTPYNGVSKLNSLGVSGMWYPRESYRLRKAD